MPRTPRAIELREITTDADWDAVMGLDRGHGPVHHINAIDDIRLEAAEEARAMPKAVRRPLPSVMLVVSVLDLYAGG